MPVTVSIRTDITLAELIVLRKDGFQVEETPHVGNLALSTLALSSLGFAPKLVDITIGDKDTLFYPHCVIKKGMRKQIACAATLTTHNRCENGSPIAHTHTRPLEALELPGFTHSSWVKQRANPIHRILDPLTTNEYRALWERHVDGNGRVTRPPSPCQPSLEAIHKVTVPHDGEGWVIPNPVNILLDWVFGALETERDHVYMLSGQSMYKYIQQKYRSGPIMATLLSGMYDQVRSNVIPGLPEHLRVTLVPIPVLRHFVAPYHLRDALDKKLRYYEKCTAGMARCGELARSKHMPYKFMLRHKTTRRAILTARAGPLELACAESENGVFYTQHDLDSDGTSVYVPEPVLNLSFQAMHDIVLRMKRL